MPISKANRRAVDIDAMAAVVPAAHALVARVLAAAPADPVRVDREVRAAMIAARGRAAEIATIAVHAEINAGPAVRADRAVPKGIAIATAVSAHRRSRCVRYFVWKFFRSR